MYELYRYILPFRKTNFNPFRLAAAVASCSPPSPASGDGSYDDRAFSAAPHFMFLSTLAPFGRISSETARFSDDKTRFSERTDVEAVGIGVPHADPKTRLSA